MRIAVIAVEGVLSETSNLRSSPPTALGRDLFNCLKEGYRTVLLSAHAEYDLARMWLKKEHFSRYAMVLSYPNDSMFSPPMWKVQAVKEMLADGWDVGMYIDTEEQTVQSLQNLGVTTLLVSHPTSRPGRIPEDPGPLRKWDEIEARVETKNLLEQGG